jgi:aldehyde:ferredoxin oxidoreductase
MGPVTTVEYESRQERYDEQLKKDIGVDPTGKSTEEKLKILRKYREKQYTLLQDAVYQERRWTQSGCPTIELVEDLRIDYDDIIKYIKPYQ